MVQYETRVSELQAGISQLQLPQIHAAAIFAIALGVFLTTAFYAIRGEASFFWSSLPVPVAAISARRLQRYRELKLRMWRLKRFYDRSVRRMQGDGAGTGVTGEEFANPGHVYATDLGVVGEGSLFELLCTARTSIGRRGLADYLLKPQVLEETLSRQDAVRELHARTDLREKIATLGDFDFSESCPGAFEDWLHSSRFSVAFPLRVLSLITSTLLLGFVVAGLLGVILWANVAIAIAPLLALHAGIGIFFRSRVNRMLPFLHSMSIETSVLREGLQILEQERFQSVKLRQLTEQVRDSSRSIRKLERLLDAIGQRDKDWFYLASRALLAGTQSCIAIEQWRTDHGVELTGWIRVWAEFEALNALATYSFENPDNTFPEFVNIAAHFEAQGLGHPLLPHASCVANDVSLSRECPVYVISGSNMSGKSTLLRSIGLNAVLAFAGAPVRARALRLSGLSIFASLSTVDSLLNGKSKFLAEVDRLRQAIESDVPCKPVLFLVDEIFGGTNSRDRRTAAEAVVRTLLNRGAIGALSTHDLTLTEIVNAPGTSGANMHMASRNERDPLEFDYRLKAGITTETNALAIARMAGVPV
jgi:hypothetical protein